MRSSGLLTGTVSLLVAITLTGCSSDDGEGPDGAPSSAPADGSDAASESEGAVSGDCELEVPRSDVRLNVGAAAAEEALAAAEVETTSVDVQSGSSLARCQISWDDEAGRGGTVSVSAVKPGSLSPETQPGSYPLGEWTCFSLAFDKRNAGGICATDGADVSVVVNPGDAESAEAFLEAFIPTLTA